MHASFLKKFAAVASAATLALAGCSGSDGANGANGSSCTVTQNGNGTATITCTDGTTATVTDGTDGTSCTVTDNGNGTKTITCQDGTSVTVYDGVVAGAELGVDRLHGAAFLQSEGEFAACPPGVTSGCGKVFVDAQITSATADAAGLVTVNFSVSKGGDPYTTLAGMSADVVKLVPGANGSASEWVAYIYRKQEVTTTGDWPAPIGTVEWQPTSESAGTGATNGTLTNHGDGTYTYVFRKNLCAFGTAPSCYVTKDGTPTGTQVAYERNLTHRVSIMMGGHQGPTDDASFDFVPDGSALTERRDIVQTATCQKCHGWEFHGHGGNRLSVENCDTCHVPNAYDPHGGETIDMKVMIHKIHAGRELPTVEAGGEYAIWGNNNTKHEWPLEEFPAVIENCTACHTGTATQVDNWKTMPTRAACGSCHDDVDFATGANHPAPGGVQTDDSTCSGCHTPAGSNWSVTDVHAWTTKIEQNNPEFAVELSVSAPANGTHFVVGESPVVTLKLRDLEAVGTPYIDHTTVVQDLTAEGCTPGVPCPPKDGLFASASFMVHGPRGLRKPALSTGARAQILSGTTGPWDLSAASAALALKVDQGQDLVAFDATGGDYLMLGTISVPVSGGTFANVAAATTTEIVAWLNANTAFTRRAIAFDQGGKVGIRSRNLGKVFALQLQASAVATAVFAGDTAVKLPASSGSSNVRQQALPANNDPKVSWFTDRIEYALDPVDDLAPGTYVAGIEIGDRGRVSATNYKTPSVGWVTFQVKQAAAELPPAGNCNLCHQNADGIGFVLDFSRHYKKFGVDAVDQCGPCHDQQPTVVTGSSWGGGKPISKRVHAVHNGVNLNYPLLTVDYANGDPSGRNWQITFPQDVRNCETCHPAGTTSGSWKTRPARLPCMGCHDADAATAHIRAQTYDPTPLDPWSGDEQESCRACH